MQYTVPHYYKKFQCIADKCPDTCCAGWQIVIDENSLKKYKSYKGPFRARLYNSIQWKEGVFRQYRKRCEFLDEENLCDLYREAGPKMLCKTCRTYPRHIEEYEGLREISLSLSCPEAARIILTDQERLRLLKRENPKKQETYEDFDFLFFEKLMEVREALFQILQERSQPFSLRLAMVLALGHDFQQRIDKGRLFKTEELVERYVRPGAFLRFRGKLDGEKDWNRGRGKILKASFEAFSKLEVLREDWPEFLEKACDSLYTSGPEGYQENRREFLSYLKEQGSLFMPWEQMCVYFLFTYFCGAVYDGRAFEKVKLAAVSTLWLEEWMMAVYQQQGKTLALEDIQKIAWRYSRELEHSDLNLNRLEEILEKEAVFSLPSLLEAVWKS